MNNIISRSSLEWLDMRVLAKLSVMGVSLNDSEQRITEALSGCVARRRVTNRALELKKKQECET
jgi:hypothetical protein